MKFDDVVNFTRQLATMISAGLSLTDSLSILKMQVSGPFQTKIEGILRSVEGGSTFADALAEHPDVFSKVYVALVRAGESAGVLDTILTRLADNLEKQREFRAKTKGALIYPVIVMIGMAIVGVVMMVFVLPKLTAMYKDFNADLPMVTKILMGISDFISKTWYLAIMGVFGLMYLLRWWRNTEIGALKYDQLMLRLPIFGKIKEMVTVAEFARTLSLLVGAGVPLVDGLKIVQGVVGNQVYARALQRVATDVEKGNVLAVSLAREEAFPILVSQMVSAGEQTGKLDEILERLAMYFETESEHAIKNLSTAMEPVIMILLGLGVGFMIVAIIVPIYNLSNVF
ncbi:MAG TPA: type II secretion system F family protein [Candidatus Aenigmarchaeota archaeon]|nr:type II secretion system F family protein [Candidatus Aenigmarchaeota archaeon]